MMAFRGEFLRQQRVLQGLTLRDLGEKINMAASMVWRWEQGLSTPRPSKVRKIAKALKVKPADLFAMNEKKQPKSKEARNVTEASTATAASS